MKYRSEKKHILLLNRSFWPDIEATGQFLTELCEQLASHYKVTVIAGRSYYVSNETFKLGKFYSREIFNGIKIIRVRHTKFWKGNIIGRIINWFTYSILAFSISVKMSPKIIIVGTDPPFLGPAVMLISCLKSIPYIYNCRDLFPEVGVGLGKINHGFLSYIFDSLNKKALDKALLIICLGQSMRNRLRAKGIPEERIRIIPDWEDTSKVKPVPKKDNYLLKELGLVDKFIIMYSGNIGLSQDFSPILHSLSMMEERSLIYLIFVGEGSSKGSLRKKVQSLNLKNVLFLPYQPKEVLSFSLGMADLHLVPLKKGMTGAIVPSKIYGIMAAGKPYLALSDKKSEPARFIGEFGCGLWADPDDIRAITDTLKWALNHPRELEEMGKKGRWIAETRFDKNVVVKKWFKVLDDSM